MNVFMRAIPLAGFFFVLCFLSLGSPAHAQQPVDPQLVQTLTQVPAGSFLEVRDLAGNRIIGTLAGVRDGQIVLRKLPLHEGDAALEESVDLADVHYLARQQRAAGTGFGAGFTTGALLGGSLGLLFGLVVDSLDGQEDGTAVLGMGLTGGVAGGVVLGGVGAGIGALAREWNVLYRSPTLMATDPGWESRGRTSFSVAVGGCSGIQNDLDYTESGPFASLRLNRTLGSHWELGPEVSYFNVGGTYEREVTVGTGTYNYRESVNSVIAFSVVGGWVNARRGWSPYVNLGAGLYVDGNSYPGLSFGGGFRFRDEDGVEMRFDLRDHMNLQEDDLERHMDHLLTAGAVFSFSL